MKFSTKMKSCSRWFGLAAAALASVSVALAPQVSQAQAAAGGQPALDPVYAFKPKDISYRAPMKPVQHIADIIAAHKGQTDWEYPVVKDAWFFIQYISMGPGKQTPMSMQSDTSIIFIINSGKVRFTFKEFPPIEAGEDGMVSIPPRTPYTIETISSTPSIRFEVRNAQAGTLFPVADNAAPPVAPPGFETVRVDCNCFHDAVKDMKPNFFDYAAWVKANPNGERASIPPKGTSYFLIDPNVFMNTARSVTGVPLPPASVVGHFHVGQAEWFYVLEGNMAVRIEGQGDVHGVHGDVIYSPHGAYHQSIMLGAPSSRAPAGKTGVMDSTVQLTPPAQN